MRVAVHQSQYLPWPPYVRKIAAVDHFVVMDDVQFHRGGVQNRNQIADATAAWWLTIPVQRGSLTDRIDEKHATDTAWGEQHWRSIENTYARADNFEQHAPSLRDVLVSAPLSLVAANESVLAWLLGRVGLDRPITSLSSLEIGSAKTQRLVDVCVALGASTYVTGTGAADYLDVDSFREAGIEVEFLASAPPEYERGGGAPLVGLSMVDMLFHAHEEAVQHYLESR